MPRLPDDLWDSGDAYEPYVGRWSRLVAAEFIPWLDVEAGLDWLDVGCGTGALSATILASAEPASLLGVDPSRAFVEYARERIRDPRAVFDVADARSLPVGDGAVDAAVSGLVLNFVREPAQAASELARAVRAGAVVGAYVWDYAGEMQLMRHFWNAAVELDPSAGDLDEGFRFPICHPDALAELFEGARFRDVETRVIDVPTVFRDFEDYWSPFLGGPGPAPAHAMSLGEGRRSELRDRIRTGLPTAADGSISLIARGWAVKGRR